MDLSRLPTQEHAAVRTRMWVKLIPGFASMGMEERKKAKRKFADFLGKKPHEVHTRKELEEMVTIKIQPNYIVPPATSLAPTAEPETAYCGACVQSPNTKSKKMTRYHDDYSLFDTPVQTQTDETKKRQYLVSRLNDIEDEKIHAARKRFFLDNDQAPRTFAELLERLTSGRYTLNERNKDTPYWHLGDMLYGNTYSAITWRDPKNPADNAGFEAYEKALVAEFTKAQDVIAIGDPADGLKALQAFEAWEPTTATATAQ